MVKHKKFFMALIFMFTVIIPMSGALAAGTIKFSSTYVYITSGKEQNAGTVTVSPGNDAYDTVHDAVYIDITLPDGVKFTNIPCEDDITTGNDKLVQLSNTDNYGFRSAGSDFIRVWVAGNEFDKDHSDASVKFDFTKIDHYDNNKLDINKDFTGNLSIDVEVIGVESDSIVWTEGAALTIAKVAGTNLFVSASTPPEISSKLTNQDVSKLTISESTAGTALDNIIELKLPDGFTWVNGSWSVDSNHGLTADVALKENKDSVLVVSNFNKTQTFPGEIIINGARINIPQDASDGNVMVQINSTSPACNVEPGQVCIAIIKKPILVNANASVVIGNDSGAGPQAGLNEAKIVYETAVAPGITRFLALFDLSKNAYKIGPVSNARKHFVNLASSHIGGFAHVGGCNDSLDLIPEASIVSLDQTHGAEKYFFLSPDKEAPYNLYTNTDLLRQGMQDKGAIMVAPSTGLPTGSMTGGSTANRAIVRFPGQAYDVIFNWNQAEHYYERYEGNEPFVLENDQFVIANNVAVVVAKHERVYVDNSDEWQVQPVLKGSGPAFFYKEGKMWEGKWNSDSIDSLMEFTVENRDMLFETGNTFILVIEDNDNPVVESTDPGDGSTGISNNGTITVSFNERIQAGSSFSNIEVKDKEGSLIDVSVSIDGRELMISPVDNLCYNTAYTVTIPNTAIEDLIGNPLISDYEFSFTTGSKSNTGGSSGGSAPKRNSDNDISSKINELLKNASQGGAITVDSVESEPQIINNATLQNVSDTGCKLSINFKAARTSLTFEPEALLTSELEKAGEDTLVEISASIVEGKETQDAADYTVSAGGKTLRVYHFDITVKEDKKDDGTEIHALNGNATVVLDLSDMDLDAVNTDLLAIIHQQPDGTWSEVESSFDHETKTISFNTGSLSIFAVIEKPEKEIKVIKLNIGQVDASVNGTPYTLDAKPYIDSVTNRTLVPLRFAGEALGAEVDWIAPTKNIVIKDGNTEIKLTAGSTKVSVNNDTIVIDRAPEMLSPGRTFMPLRFVSETLGASISYDSTLKQITITK